MASFQQKRAFRESEITADSEQRAAEVRREADLSELTSQRVVQIAKTLGIREELITEVQNAFATRPATSQGLYHDLVVACGLQKMMIAADVEYTLTERSTYGRFVPDSTRLTQELRSVGVMHFISKLVSEDPLLGRQLYAYLNEGEGDRKSLLKELRGFYKRSILNEGTELANCIAREFRDQNTMAETQILAGALYGLLQVRPRGIGENILAGIKHLSEIFVDVPPEITDLHPQRIPAGVYRFLQSVAEEVRLRNRKPQIEQSNDTALEREVEKTRGVIFEQSLKVNEVTEDNVRLTKKLKSADSKIKNLHSGLEQLRKANQDLSRRLNDLREEKAEQPEIAFEPVSSPSYPKFSKKKKKVDLFELRRAIAEWADAKRAEDLRLFESDPKLHRKMVRQWKDKVLQAERDGLTFEVANNVGKSLFRESILPSGWMQKTPGGYRIQIPPNSMRYSEKGWGKAYIFLGSSERNFYVNELEDTNWAFNLVVAAIERNLSVKRCPE